MTTQASSKATDYYEVRKIRRGRETKEAINFLVREYAPEAEIHQCFVRFPEFAHLYWFWLKIIGATIYGMWRPAFIVREDFRLMHAWKHAHEVLVGLFAIVQYEKPASSGIIAAFRDKIYNHARTVIFNRHVKLVTEDEKRALVDFFFYQAVWPDLAFVLWKAVHSRDESTVKRFYMLPLLLAEWNSEQSDLVDELLNQVLLVATKRNGKKLTDGVGYEYPTAQVILPVDRKILPPTQLFLPTGLDTNLMSNKNWYPLYTTKLMTVPAIQRNYFASDI